MAACAAVQGLSVLRGGWEGMRLGTAGALVFCTLATFATAGPIQDDPTNRNLNWLAIGPGAWSDSIEVLRGFRQGQGYSAGLWTLEELNASYGGHSRAAIKQALQDALATWTLKPRWVCLIGDHERSGGSGDILSDWAEYNPELGGADISWEDSTRGLWPYADIDDDGRAELFIGRLPASDPVHVARYARKVIIHDSNQDPTYNETSVMLLYDLPSGNNDPVWARTLGDSLFANWLPGPNRTALRATELLPTYADREGAAIGAWNAGPGLVLGFGVSSGWWHLVNFFNVCGQSGFWTINKLAVSDVFPVVLALSCGTVATDWGTDQFTWDCGRRPVAEQLLISSDARGAVAVIGFTRNTKQWPNFLLGKHLLLQKQYLARTWGEAVRNACNSALDEDPTIDDHIFEVVLEGDPAVHVYTSAITGVDDLTVGSGNPVLTCSNPSRGRCLLTVALTTQAEVSLEVYDIRGARVAAVFRGPLAEGTHDLTWDYIDSRGSGVAQGVYFVKLKVAGKGSLVRRIVVLQ